MGGTKTLTRTELADGWQIALASTDQGSKTFEVRTLADGSQTRTTTFADGTSAQQVRALDGTLTTTFADGTVDTEQRSADPRYGIETPIIASHTHTLPSGLTYTETATRAVTLADVSNPTSITSLTDTRVVNGQTWTTSFDASTKTWTVQSPVGRRAFRRLNAFGDLAETRTDTLLGNVLAYDSFGRPSTQTQGSRQSLFLLLHERPLRRLPPNPSAILSSTPPPSRETPWDAPFSELDPQSNLTGLSWDAADNLASVTPPGRPAHVLDYTPVDLMSQYSPPVLASLPEDARSDDYNLARQVTRATRPDGLVTSYTYDSTGRLSDITTPGGTYHRDYYGLSACTGCSAGRVSHLTSPDAVALDYQYDGELLTKATWSGPVKGAVAFEYNTDFRVTTETVTSTSGSSGYRFGFDADTLLTCASPTNCVAPGADALKLTYGGANTHGRLLGSALGTVKEALTYNTVGELATQTGAVGTTTVFSEVYDSAVVPRDALVAPSAKSKSSTAPPPLGTTRMTWRGGQNVQLNGGAYESYAYDGNGNRLTVVRPTGTTTATHDDQDRLLTFGTWTYTYTANGEIRTKTNSATGQSSTYTYDVFGNLKRVDLPAGVVIEYLVRWSESTGRQEAQRRARKAVAVRRPAAADRRARRKRRYAGPIRLGVEEERPGVSRERRRYLPRVRGSARLSAGARQHDERGGDRRDATRCVGLVLEDSVSALMPFGFAGGLYDAETGLVRFGARDYDASVGRWVSKDPIRFRSQEPNVYLYASGDPVSFVDRSGRATEPAPWWWPEAAEEVGAAAAYVASSLVLACASGSVCNIRYTRGQMELHPRWHVAK